MPIKVLMPALSPTMTEGKLAKWLKKEGETVKSGQVLAEIETDKATMELEAVDEGTLGKILIAGGTEGVAVNTPIALILEEGENASALADAGNGAAAPKAVVPASPAPSGAAIATAPIPKAEIKVNVEQMKKNLDQAIGQLNDNMRDGGRNLAFAMDETLGRPIIVVKKEDTGEVIRQIPNEVVIKVAHNLDKLKGLLFNTRA